MFLVNLIIALISCSVLLYVFFSYVSLSKVKCDNEKMVFISTKISDGASSFMKCLYKYLSFFVLSMSLIIAFIASTSVGSCYIDRFSFLYFIFGSLLSMLAGFIAMKISTKSNILVALNIQKSLRCGFNNSLNGGNLIGMSIVGFGLLGLSLIFLFNYFLSTVLDFYFCTNIVLFALGVECVALFSRVAGGIFTKAADIGADLVGKIEKNIPEDDSRNPAVIADNVGDNVGDIAGMGSDLLGSFVSAIVGCIFLVINLFGGNERCFDVDLVVFPLLFCFCCTLVSIFVNKVIIKGKSENIGFVFRNSVIIVTILNAIAAAILIFNMFPRVISFDGIFFTNVATRGYFCLLIGLFISLLVSFFTRCYTDSNYYPLKYIIKQTQTGASTNIIGGLSVGMESLLFPVLFYSCGALLTYNILGFYGVSLAAVAVMSTAATHLSIDAFGPIADNAGGIVEMSKLGGDVRKNTDILDSLGNTTAATGKSFSVTSAVFTFFSIFVCILSVLKIKYFVGDIYIVSGLLLGSVIPYLFSSMVIKSVGFAAMKIIDEVRRQFKLEKVSDDSEMEPDYDKCISISTVSSIKEMVKPVAIVILVPVLILMLFNVNMCIGFLVGLFLSSILLGIFHSNVGGAWDNVKKAFEKGVIIDGIEYSKKNVSSYKAAVVGDTVGDPLKDTSGPSMNIVLKITSFIFIILSPLFLKDLPEKVVNRFNSFNVLSNGGTVVKSIKRNGTLDKNNCGDLASLFSGVEFGNKQGYTSKNVGAPYKKSKKNAEPKVYVNKDENGNYEKLIEYPNGYVYESYYSN